MRDAIYHNPRCSKSRQTLGLLEEKGVKLDIVTYLDSPPSTAELEEICQALGVTPLEMMRTKETRFAELGLSTGDTRPAAEWFDLMVANPILIERPMVCLNGKAVIGRPPENVLEII